MLLVYAQYSLQTLYETHGTLIIIMKKALTKTLYAL